MNLIGGIVAGAIAGILGAALWAAIAYYGNIEIGWIAWGIGALVGFAVTLGSKGGGVAPAAIAVLITVVSLCGGKYLAVYSSVNQMDALGAFDAIEITGEDYVATVVGEEVVRKIAAGEAIAFRNGIRTHEEVEDVSDYPQAMVDTAIAKWEGMSSEEQEAYKTSESEKIKSQLSEIKSSIAAEGFKRSFGGMDILFFLLGVFSAGKIAYSDPD